MGHWITRSRRWWKWRAGLLRGACLQAPLVAVLEWAHSWFGCALGAPRSSSGTSRVSVSGSMVQREDVCVQAVRCLPLRQPSAASLPPDLSVARQSPVRDQKLFRLHVVNDGGPGGWSAWREEARTASKTRRSKATLLCSDARGDEMAP
jgi:hypothetical protein